MRLERSEAGWGGPFNKPSDKSPIINQGEQAEVRPGDLIIVDGYDPVSLLACLIVSSLDHSFLSSLSSRVSNHVRHAWTLFNVATHMKQQVSPLACWRLEQVGGSMNKVRRKRGEGRETEAEE